MHKRRISYIFCLLLILKGTKEETSEIYASTLSEESMVNRIEDSTMGLFEPPTENSVDVELNDLEPSYKNEACDPRCTENTVSELLFILVVSIGGGVLVVISLVLLILLIIECNKKKKLGKLYQSAIVNNKSTEIYDPKNDAPKNRSLIQPHKSNAYSYDRPVTLEYELAAIHNKQTSLNINSPSNLDMNEFEEYTRI